MAYPIRSQFGAEEEQVSKAAAKFEIACPQCRMKFDNHRLLERHRSGFCERGTVEERAQIPTVTADEVHGYCSGQKDKQSIGNLTLAELKQAFQSSSLSELQQRSLHAEQLALAAQLRSYKLSAFAPQQTAKAQQRERQKNAEKEQAAQLSGMLAGPSGRPTPLPNKNSASSITAIIAQSIIANDQAKGEDGPVLPRTYQKREEAAKANSKEDRKARREDDETDSGDEPRRHRRRGEERRKEKKRSKHRRRRRGDSDSTDDEEDDRARSPRQRESRRRDDERTRETERRRRSREGDREAETARATRGGAAGAAGGTSYAASGDRREAAGSGAGAAGAEHAGAALGAAGPREEPQSAIGGAGDAAMAARLLGAPPLSVGGPPYQPQDPMLAPYWAPAPWMYPGAGMAGAEGGWGWGPGQGVGGFGGGGWPDALGGVGGVGGEGGEGGVGAGAGPVGWPNAGEGIGAGGGMEEMGMGGMVPAAGDGGFGGGGRAGVAEGAGRGEGAKDDAVASFGGGALAEQSGGMGREGGAAGWEAGLREEPARARHLGGGGIGAVRGLQHLKQQDEQTRGRSKTWYEVLEATGVDAARGQAMMEAEDAVGTDNLVGMAIDHGHRMTRLKEETERLELAKRLVKLENQLEAGQLDRQRMEWLAKQKAQIRQAIEIREDLPEGGNYDPVLGFELHIDWIQAVPADAAYVQLKFGLLQGGQPLMPIQTSKIEPAIYQVAQVTDHVPVKRIIFHISKFYKQLPPVDDVLLLVEMQEVTESVSSKAIGWTAVPIFSGDNQLLEGLFKAPMLTPPLLLDLIPISRYDTAPRIHGSALYLRLRPNSPEVSELIDAGGGPLVLQARGGRFEEGWPHGAEVPLHLYELPWLYQVETPRWVRQGYELPKEEESDDDDEEEAVEVKPKVVVREEARDIAEEAWCPYLHDEDADLRRCMRQDLIMVSMDAVRFLPDNVALARVRMAVVDERGGMAFPNAELTELPEIRSGVHSPTFKLAAVFEAQAASLRSWVRVTVEAVDVHTRRHVTVGFAVAPLFISPDTGRALSEAEAAAARKALARAGASLARTGETPREVEEETGLLVREGGLQLPLRAATSMQGPPERWQADAAAIGRLPRLPCCSVLLRLFVNPGKQDLKNALQAADLPTQLDEMTMDDDDDDDDDAGRRPSGAALARAASGSSGILKLVQQLTRIKPKYSSGFYNSNPCLPSGMERVTFRQRLATFWRDLSPRDVLHKLFDRDSAERLRLAADDHAVLDALVGLFEVSKPAPAIDLKYFCAYNASIGFKVSVDGANNLPTAKGQWPIVVFGVVPPCAYFGPEQLSLDAHFHSSLDPGCTIRFPRWSETFVTQQNVPFRGTGTALVIQVFGISREAKKGQVVLHKTEIGWTAMPLFFHSDLPYLLDGGFQLPMYKGAVPRVFPKFIDDVGVDAALKREETKKRIHPLDGASALVRVSDLQRGMTSHPIDAPNSSERSPGIPPDCDDRFLREWLDGTPRIKQSNLAKYRKVASTGFFSGKEPQIKDLIGNMPFEEFDKRMRLDTQALTRISPDDAAAQDKGPTEAELPDFQALSSMAA